MSAALPIPQAPSAPRPAPRDPDFLMRPERLAAFQPSRVSASRALMAQAIAERWKITTRRFDIGADSAGTAVYEIATPGGSFSFMAFSNTPQRAGRTGRIIGRAWDMTGSLVEGVASEAVIETTRRELPKLYAGRATPGTLIWCRSNRSMRVFDATVAALAEGRQPEPALLAQVCYLMRNTGLDGNGTFGTRSFLSLEEGHALRHPLAAQMLAAYMMREFAADLANHLAALQSPGAVALSAENRRFLGVGNGSALGLILFINNHPRLIDAWIRAREEAIAAARALPVGKDDARLTHLETLLRRAARFRREDRMVYDAFAPSALIAEQLEEVAMLVARLRETGSDALYPLDELAKQVGARFHPEAEETLLSLMIELVPEQADRLARAMIVTEEMEARPAMRLAELRDILRREYQWALEWNLSAPGSYDHIWYKSATAEEPRRGLKSEAPADAFNLGLDVPGLVQALDKAMAGRDPAEPVARLLLARPDLRQIITRVQSLAGLRYHQPRANIMGDDFVPAHLVRLMNVALHGVDKTRDYLARNLRGVLFHGAPTAADLAAGAEPDWFYPPEPQA
ncbi:hypothetical protein J8J14_19160 [Roseomonas sp. SSH11]|uniref:Uncharacterized protein n=1 Tax=Pararoseomonas baculiformis TaxID=2820812 RepID=A0ABS4AIS2_9PROT|nr:hypothetical protein [Pararoseomonas baculiformis]MBP0446898.1 hypothetical protein [Pararoseomonas baculiformis]